MENNQTITNHEQAEIINILNETKMNIADKVILITPEAVMTVTQKIYELARESAIEELKRKEDEDKKEQEDVLLTQEEASKMLGKCINTLWKWRKQGFIEGVNVGGEIRYRTSDVKKILSGKSKSEISSD